MLKRVFLFDLYSLLFSVLLLAGSTFAWMTDTVTSGNNRLLAGNLDLEAEYMEGYYNGEAGEPGWVEPFSGSSWQSFDALVFGEESAFWLPGEMKAVTVKLTNAGTIPLRYELYLHKSGELAGKTADGADLVISQQLAFSMTSQPGPDTNQENWERESLWGVSVASPSDYSVYKEGKDLTAMRKRITEDRQNGAVEVVKRTGEAFTAAENHSKSITGELEAGKTAYINIVLYLPAYTSFQKNEGADPYVTLGITVLGRQKAETETAVTPAASADVQALMKAPSPALMKASPSEYTENCMVQHVKREKITLTARVYEDLEAAEPISEEEMSEIDQALVRDIVPGFTSAPAGPDSAEVSVFKKDILFEESDDGEEYTGVPGFIIYRNTDAAKKLLAEVLSLAGNEETEDGTELYLPETGYTPLYADAGYCWQGAITMDEADQWPPDAALMCYSFGVTGIKEETQSPKTLRLNIGKNRKIREICCEDEYGYTEDLSQSYLYDPDSGSLEFTAHGEGMNLLTILLSVGQE